jgi:hypothetical protein
LAFIPRGIASDGSKVIVDIFRSKQPAEYYVVHDDADFRAELLADLQADQALDKDATEFKFHPIKYTDDWPLPAPKKGKKKKPKRKKPSAK